MKELRRCSGGKHVYFVVVSFPFDPSEVIVLKVYRRTESTSIPAMLNPSIFKEDETEWECHSCMRLTTRKCSLCGRDHFCSDACQMKSSGAHLFTCSRRPLTSADYLWKSIGQDLLPPDEDVLEDFGFNNVPFGGNRSYLLGVYQGLYRSGRVSSEDIHEWRVTGILADKIKEFYYEIPETHRGQYFPWFLKNIHVLDRPISKEEAQQKLIATFYDQAKPYLDIEDRDKTARDLQPQAKGHSYNLLAQMLQRCSPNPTEETWYSFGFVTCRSRGEESMLVDLYQLLLTTTDGSFFYEFHNRRRGTIRPATFTQFWKAYESSTLIQLMDSKGLREFRSRLPFLEVFLSTPPAKPRPSVWDLKQFLEIRDPIDYPPMPSVSVEYGFANCRTSEETCMLMEIYDQVLGSVNPLQLHEACVAGALFRFAGDYVQMEEQWSLLMRNPYPFEIVEETEMEQRSRSEGELDQDGNNAGFLSSLFRSLGIF